MKQEELHELPHKEIVKSVLIDLCTFYITVPTVLDTYLSSRLNDLSEYSLRLTAMSSFFQAVQTSTRMARTCECILFFYYLYSQNALEVYRTMSKWVLKVLCHEIFEPQIF